MKCQRCIKRIYGINLSMFYKCLNFWKLYRFNSELLWYLYKSINKFSNVDF